MLVDSRTSCRAVATLLLSLRCVDKQLFATEQQIVQVVLYLVRPHRLSKSLPPRGLGRRALGGIKPVEALKFGWTISSDQRNSSNTIWAAGLPQSSASVRHHDTTLTNQNLHSLMSRLALEIGVLPLDRLEERYTYRLERMSIFVVRSTHRIAFTISSAVRRPQDLR
jgi:hypothetical protein